MALQVAMSTMVSACMTAAAPSGAVFSSSSSVRVASPAPLVAPLRMSQRLHFVVRASPQGTDLGQSVQSAIEEAEEVCAADETSGNCAAAWDEVEELAAAVAHKKVSDKESKDPLEAFCKEVPEADECRVYED